MGPTHQACVPEFCFGFYIPYILGMGVGGISPPNKQQLFFVGSKTSSFHVSKPAYSIQQTHVPSVIVNIRENSQVWSIYL